jgi:alkylation response protein AidB-like acyl-CoA dehydrogenase
MVPFKTACDQSPAVHTRNAVIDNLGSLGGARFMRGCWVERIYHDVRVMAIGGGFEEIMFDLAGRQMAF